MTGFGYNAEYYDAATGMLNLRARQYGPTINRFSQKDVLKGSAWLPQSLNRYAYVMNDPVSYADPSGETSALVLGLGSGAAALLKALVAALLKALVAALAGAGVLMLGASTSSPTTTSTPRNYSDKNWDNPLLAQSPPLCTISLGTDATPDVSDPSAGQEATTPSRPDELSPTIESSTITDNTENPPKREYKKPKKGTGKEKANDVPNWAKGKKPYKGESGKDFAKRLLDDKYGKNNYPKGPGTEYNKLQKWGDRGFL